MENYLVFGQDTKNTTRKRRMKQKEVFNESTVTSLAFSGNWQNLGYELE